MDVTSLTVQAQQQELDTYQKAVEEVRRRLEGTRRGYCPPAGAREGRMNKKCTVKNAHMWNMYMSKYSAISL
jgi:hypothetical protein